MFLCNSLLLDLNNRLSLKGQFHAIFSNTLKIEKTLFG